MMTLSDILLIISAVISNGIALFVAWNRIHVKLKELDMKQKAFEMRVQLLVEEVATHKTEESEIWRELRQDAKETKMLLQTLNINFEKHLSFHEGKQA